MEKTGNKYREDYNYSFARFFFVESHIETFSDIFNIRWLTIR